MPKLDLVKPGSAPGATSPKKSDLAEAQRQSLMQGAQDGARLAGKPEAPPPLPAELALVPVNEVKDRADQDTRPLKPFDLVDLAYAIRDHGLISPIAVDCNHRLLAGGHRRGAHLLMACVSPEDREITFRQLVGRTLDDMLARKAPDQKGELQTKIDELFKRVRDLGHHPNRSKILTRVYPDLDSSTPEGRERALVIETTENTRRKGYTDSELRKIAERFEQMGFGEGTHGDKNLYSALGYYTSLSYTTLRRKLGKGSDPNASVRRMRSGQLTNEQLQAALRKFAEGLPESDRGPLQAAVVHLEQLQGTTAAPQPSAN